MLGAAASHVVGTHPAESPCQHHGEATHKITEENPRIMRTEYDYASAIRSWRDIAKYREGLDTVTTWIEELLEISGDPVLWTENTNAREAPIFLVNQHAAKAHGRYHQWACRVCGYATQKLYHAHWTPQECVVARRGVMQFLRPQLDKLHSFQRVASGDFGTFSLLMGTIDWGTSPAAASQQHATLVPRSMPSAVTRPQTPQQNRSPLAGPPPPPFPARREEMGPWKQYRSPQGHDFWCNTITEDWFYVRTGSTRVPEEASMRSTSTNSSNSSWVVAEAASSSDRTSSVATQENTGTHPTFFRNLYSADVSNDEAPVGDFR